MKKSFLCLFIIMIVCCFLSACQGQHSGRKQPEATKGILDLSEWDFGRDGPIKLDGEWEYYEGTLLTPDSFVIKPGPEKTAFSEVVGKNHQGKGSATFRLTIKFRDTDNIYGLKPVSFSSTHKLWADGNLLYPNVGTGESRKQYFLNFYL